MEIQLYWPRCSSFKQKPIDAYWIEASETEMMNIVYPILTQTEKAKFDSMKDVYIAKTNSEVAKKDHYYFLISKDISNIITEAWYYPYSGMWNAYCPFKRVQAKLISNLDEIKSFKPKIIGD